MQVVKRSGAKVPFDLSKWQAQIAKVCEGVADVSPSMIEISAQAEFRDGMTTRELDQIALKSMINLIDEEENPDVGNINYQYVAGKQRISMLRKDVYGDYRPLPLLEIVKKNVALGLYTPDLLTWYTEEEWNKLDGWIDHEKDEELPYAAVDQLVEKYLVRNRATGKIVETPQVRYMVAAAVAFHAEKHDRLKYVREFYEAASDGMFTLATPVLAGLGTKTKQFSSCVLIRTDDSLKSIFATGQVMADYASKRAGIGLEIGRMRPLGAEIRGGEVMHTGIVPFLKKWFADLRSCSQGGIRNASATVNLPIWHYQFDDFIVLKNNQGTDETRVRQMDYCVVLSAFFWRRLKSQGTITFFDPNQVPELYQAFYNDSAKFEQLYVELEATKEKLGLRTKTETAEKVFGWLMKERSDTGRYYLLNIDNVMNQGPFNAKVHPIYQTNLCFSGDTLVAVADGRNAVRMDQLVEEGEFDVFSAVKAGGRSNTRGRRSGGRMHCSEWKTVVRRARAVRTGERQLVRVHLDDGDFFDATPDHRLATTTYGEWVEAGSSLGAELEPFATYALEAKYRGVQSRTGNHQHRLIWERTHGSIPAGHEVDHIDRLGTDHISNLQVLPHAEHLRKTALEVSGAGNSVHLVDREHHQAITARTSFLERNPSYSGFTDEQLIKEAELFFNSGGATTVNALSRHFGMIGAPKSLSKNRFQQHTAAGFTTSWQYLIECALGRATYVPPIDYTQGTKFHYESRPKELGWTWEERPDGLHWKGRSVVRVEVLGIQPCYDVQVLDTGLSDDEHNFYVITSGDKQHRTSRGVLVHNCTEIMLPTEPFETVEDPNGRIALCTLGSSNWGKFRHPEEMRRSLRILHRALHNLLQYQDFLSIHSELHNKEFEPLGIGVTNLAYWHAKRKLKYGEEESLAEVKRWMEHQAFYLTEMSVELAEEKGACLESRNTWYGQGVFPWERRANGVNELTSFKPEMPWEPLRERMKKSGVRNATTMAIAPVESSSVVLNSTNGVNLLKQLIVVKESKAGIIPQVAPEYRKLKKQYELLFEQKDCLPYIKTVAVLQAYVDQGISSDTYYSPKHFEDGKIPLTLVTRNLMLAHKWGLKSHYYHLVDKEGAVAAIKKEEPVAEEKPIDEDYCESCVL